MVLSLTTDLSSKTRAVSMRFDRNTKFRHLRADLQPLCCPPWMRVSDVTARRVELSKWFMICLAK